MKRRQIDLQQFTAAIGRLAIMRWLVVIVLASRRTIIRRSHRRLRRRQHTLVTRAHAQLMMMMMMVMRSCHHLVMMVMVSLLVVLVMRGVCRIVNGTLVHFFSCDEIKREIFFSSSDMRDDGIFENIRLQFFIACVD